MTKTKKNKKTIVKKPKVNLKDSKTRKKPKYKSFRLHSRVKHLGPALPNFWSISKKAVNLMVVNYKPLGWFFIVYGLLYLIFVRGFVSPVNIDEIKSQITELSGGPSTLSDNITIMGLLLGSAINVGGEVTGLYQMLFYVTSGLALIWLYRQQQAGNKVTLKEAYYRGMYPLIPFLLILVLIGIQTIPASIGNFLFSTVTQNGLAVSFAEQLVWLSLYILLIILSLYLISSSLIAMFIVTLPEMTPMVALRKAKELVNFRRFSVLIRVVSLLIIVILAFIAFVLPALFVSAVLAQLVFFIVTVMAVPFVIAYLFVLYRELL